MVLKLRIYSVSIVYKKNKNKKLNQKKAKKAMVSLKKCQSIHKAKSGDNS